MQLRLERQRSPVADEVSAITAVARPILIGTLYALQRDRIQRFGDYSDIRLTDLAREYRAGDGDCGICFEYAVHDAVRRDDPLVLERVDEVLTRFCRIDTGLTNLPFRDFALNEAWLELVLIAQTLTFATQALLIEGDLSICEPKRLRYRLLHTAGRLAFHARRARLRLPRSWPWAQDLAAAFARLAALPAPG